jgi:broad specificity phosphatase PhoE
MYLRHGRATKNDDTGIVGGRNEFSPLVPKGVEESIQAGYYLAKHAPTVDDVYASPADRTVGTARFALTMADRQILADRLSMASHRPEDLIELYPGAIEGQVRPPGYKRLCDWEWDEVVSPGGETLRMVMERGKHRLTEIGKEHLGQVVLVCGHGALLKCVLAGLAAERGGSPEVVKQLLATSIGYCTLSRLDYSPDDGLVPVYIGHPTNELNVPLPQSSAIH